MSRREHAATSSCGQAEASILLGKKGDLDLTEASPMAAGEPNTNFSSSQDQSNSSNTPEEGSVPVMIVPQIVVAPEAQADVEYDDCSSGKTYSSVSETENDEMRSIDTWSAFTHMEEFTFPLLSWRTYDSSLCENEEDTFADVGRSISAQRMPVVRNPNEQRQPPQATPAEGDGVRERLHYSQWKRPSSVPEATEPVKADARTKCAQKVSGCCLSNLCQFCMFFNRAKKTPPPRKKSSFLWIRKKPRNEVSEQRRHTDFGFQSVPTGSAVDRQTLLQPVLLTNSRLPRLHDVDKRPLLKRGTVPDRDPVPEDFFDFMKVVGTGSYGKVHLVRFRQTGQELAAKVQLTIQRKRAEIELKVMMTATTSPFLVSLHSHFSTMLALYIVMEYVPGGSLTAKLNTPFSTVAAAFYSAQIALALTHLHGLGILYRDLKPDNLLFTKDKYIKLCDFGSCYPGCVGKKKVKVSIGTPRYWAPEKLQYLPYGRPADWWSLGIILYQMLTAKFPFVTATPGFDAYMKVVLDSSPKFPSNLPADAVSACLSFLEKNPDERLGGPKEMYSVYDHPLYRRLVNWDALQGTMARPPPMYAHRSASMPDYAPD